MALANGVDVANPEQSPLRVVSVASVASADVAQGRRVPLLILDTSCRPDFEQLVHAHADSGLGDLITQWLTVGDALLPSAAYLMCVFRSPAPCAVAVEFTLPECGRVLDFVLCVRGVWLQPGRADHHPASKFHDRPSIFVEVGADFAAWEEVYPRLLALELQKMGHDREVAMQLAPQLIREEREVPERQ